MLGVVIPSCTDEYLRICFDSLENSQRGVLNRVIVVDSGLSREFKSSRCEPKYVSYEGKFVYSRAINLGVSLLSPTYDILILNDDIQILGPQDFLLVLEGYLSNLPEFVGLVGLKQWKYEQNPREGDYKPTINPVVGKSIVGGPATLIPRRVWNTIGNWDERFTEYGMEDDDYCHRVRSSGMIATDTSVVIVRHGMGGFSCTSTYFRLYGEDKVHNMYRKDRELYMGKWGFTS